MNFKKKERKKEKVKKTITLSCLEKINKPVVHLQLHKLVKVNIDFTIKVQGQNAITKILQSFTMLPDMTPPPTARLSIYSYGSPTTIHR